MAMHILPRLAFFCPQCGLRMTTIKVALGPRPSLATLSGCEYCGITLNELPRPEFPPSGDRLCAPVGRA